MPTPMPMACVRTNAFRMCLCASSCYELSERTRAHIEVAGLRHGAGWWYRNTRGVTQLA